MTVLGPSAVRAGLSSNRSWMRKRRAQSIPSVSLGSAYRSVLKAYGGGGIATPPLPADRPPVGPADQAGVLGQGAGGIAGLGRLPGLAAAVEMGSPFSTRPMGPPTADSGATWPTQAP